MCRRWCMVHLEYCSCMLRTSQRHCRRELFRMCMLSAFPCLIEGYFGPSDYRVCIDCFVTGYSPLPSLQLLDAVPDALKQISSLAESLSRRVDMEAKACLPCSHRPPCPLPAARASGVAHHATGRAAAPAHDAVLPALFGVGGQHAAPSGRGHPRRADPVPLRPHPCARRPPPCSAATHACAAGQYAHHPSSQPPAVELRDFIPSGGWKFSLVNLHLSCSQRNSYVYTYMHHICTYAS
jgi:hypothetical protein